MARALDVGNSSTLMSDIGKVELVHMPGVGGCVGVNPSHLTQVSGLGHCSLSLFRTSFSMGQPPWATPEQTQFLESCMPHLEQAKNGNGLKDFYDRTAHDFLQKWPVKPTGEESRALVDQQ